MWIVVIIVIVIGCIIFSANGNKSEDNAFQSQRNSEGVQDYGEMCKNIADQMLRDMHSGCAYRGFCVYERVEIDESNSIDDDDDKVVCYCEHYGKYVKRHSPCEYFRDAKR